MRLDRSLAMILAMGTVAATASPLSAASPPKSPSTPAAAKSQAAAHHSVLPFINDDYPRALSEARAIKKPILIEAWAPW